MRSLSGLKYAVWISTTSDIVAPVFDLLSFISFSLDTTREHFSNFLYIRSNSKYFIVNYKQDNHWYNIKKAIQRDTPPFKWFTLSY
jgi:hypothetical protein